MCFNLGCGFRMHEVIEIGWKLNAISIYQTIVKHTHTHTSRMLLDCSTTFLRSTVQKLCIFNLWHAYMLPERWASILSVQLVDNCKYKSHEKVIQLHTLDREWNCDWNENDSEPQNIRNKLVIMRESHMSKIVINQIQIGDIADNTHRKRQHPYAMCTLCTRTENDSLRCQR